MVLEGPVVLLVFVFQDTHRAPVVLKITNILLILLIMN